MQLLGDEDPSKFLQGQMPALLEAILAENETLAST